jgi:hypothetical protein
VPGRSIVPPDTAQQHLQPYRFAIAFARPAGSDVARPYRRLSDINLAARELSEWSRSFNLDALVDQPSSLMC